MRHSRIGLLSLAVALTVLGGLLGGAPVGLAQDAGSPPRPSHVHEGDCDEPGGVVQGLTPLTVPSGASAGNSEAVLAEAAFSSIPLTVDDMLASDHSLKVHLSAQQIDVYLVCGDIGGALDADGALIVGLKEQDGSGYTGIAYLVPNASGQTSVSVMIAKVLPGGGAGDDSAAAAPDNAEPGASDTGASDTGASDTGASDTGAAAAPAGVNVVGVTLTEFSINMPTELPAGLTQFNITNTGTLPHNLVIEGAGLSGQLETNLEPRTSGQITGELLPGTYTVFCPVGNGAHRSNGMELTITVN
jgi:hypothetical protein